VLILLFLPALYAAWFRIKPAADDVATRHSSDERTDLRWATAGKYRSVVGEIGSRSRPLLLIPVEK